MPNFADLVKGIANSVFNSRQPTDLYFGTVTKISPLEVTLDQKTVLTKDFLVLCRGVTEYTLDETVNHMVEKMQGGAHAPSFQAHDHQYVGRKQFTLHLGLVLGDKVALLKQQGGQKFLIIDRVVEAS